MTIITIYLAFFLFFFLSIFIFLDTDPHIECGSRSRQYADPGGKMIADTDPAGKCGYGSSRKNECGSKSTALVSIQNFKILNLKKIILEVDFS